MPQLDHISLCAYGDPTPLCVWQAMSVATITLAL